MVFLCDVCGYESLRWFGQCPQCKNWNTSKEWSEPKSDQTFYEKEPRIGHGIDHPKQGSSKKAETFEQLSVVEVSPLQRILLRFESLNRLLGGGIVPGSIALIGGDPGVGKSTLLTQLASDSLTVFYLSGEESKEQILLRAKRTNQPFLKKMWVLNSNQLEESLRKLYAKMKENTGSKILIVDSIQTLRSEEVNALPGGVVQIRECTAKLVDFSKNTNIPIIMTAHITKIGQIAGPKMVEHLVDIVLYFEGETETDLRILRSIKNRFGPTNEISVFEMKEDGLQEVTDPSERFYDQEAQYSGNTISVVLEGSTPFVTEVQALAVATHFSSPRRLSKGIDQERLNLIAAVLSKRLSIPIENHDLYLNLLGGLRCKDPGIEFPIAVSIFSSFFDKTVPLKTAVFGEVGLDGKIRSVSFPEKRIRELIRLGFERVYVPRGTRKKMTGLLTGTIEIIECEYLKQSLITIFERR